jgi:2-dehydropantoate 2-reductase
MRIAVVGTGGTGGYFGGMLARAGYDVTFLARGAQLAALQASGLTVKSRQVGAFSIPVIATDRIEDIGVVDLILFCVKAYDTIPAAEAIQPMVGPQTMVLSVQNGIDNESRIASITGRQHVLGAAATVSAQIESPGVIAVTQEPAWIRFGELDGGLSDRAKRLVDVFNTAGFGAEALPISGSRCGKNSCSFVHSVA